jgi:hypothetical protein
MGAFQAGAILIVLLVAANKSDIKVCVSYTFMQRASCKTCILAVPNPTAVPFGGLRGLLQL